MWRAVRDGKGFVIQHQQSLDVLMKKKRRDKTLAQERKWKTREAAQKVADKMNTDQ